MLTYTHHVSIPMRHHPELLTAARNAGIGAFVAATERQVLLRLLDCGPRAFLLRVQWHEVEMFDVPRIELRLDEYHDIRHLLLRAVQWPLRAMQRQGRWHLNLDRQLQLESVLLDAMSRAAGLTVPSNTEVPT